jgi:acetyltransferase-like isoleucine patch superfamily enzyme
MYMGIYIHATAEVDTEAKIGNDTKIWALSQVRKAVIGSNCIIGRNVFIDIDVEIGDNCKIQNNVLVYEGVRLEDGVFLGPAVCFTNDKRPRAIRPDGKLKGKEDWVLSATLVKTGAAIGANSVIVTGITLGQFCMVGSGAVVTRDVPDYALVIGNPARIVGYICKCGEKLSAFADSFQVITCADCGIRYKMENNQILALGN